MLLRSCFCCCYCCLLLLLLLLLRCYLCLLFQRGPPTSIRSTLCSRRRPGSRRFTRARQNRTSRSFSKASTSPSLPTALPVSCFLPSFLPSHWSFDRRAPLVLSGSCACVQSLYCCSVCSVVYVYMMSLWSCKELALMVFVLSVVVGLPGTDCHQGRAFGALPEQPKRVDRGFHRGGVIRNRQQRTMAFPFSVLSCHSFILVHSRKRAQRSYGVPRGVRVLSAIFKGGRIGTK